MNERRNGDRCGARLVVKLDGEVAITGDLAPWGVSLSVPHDRPLPWELTLEIGPVRIRAFVRWMVCGDRRIGCDFSRVDPNALRGIRALLARHRAAV